MADMTLSDIASVVGNRDGFFEGNNFIVIILFFLIFAFGGGAWGNGNAATTADVQRGFYDSILQQQLVANNTAINNGVYENAKLLYETNLNNIQNINGVNMNMVNGFDGIQNQINNLAHQMEQCCCDIKTRMLEDKYDALKNEYEQALNVTANTAQTQYILGQLGRYYTNPPYAPYPYQYPYGATYGTVYGATN